MITLNGPKCLVITCLDGCGLKFRINDTIALGRLTMENKTFLKDSPLTVFSKVNDFIISLVDTRRSQKLTRVTGELMDI